VRVPAGEHPHMQADAGVVGDGLKDVPGHRTGEVAAAITEVGQASNEINSSSTQVNASAERLSELAEQITGIVNQFKV